MQAQTSTTVRVMSLMESAVKDPKALKAILEHDIPQILQQNERLQLDIVALKNQQSVGEKKLLEEIQRQRHIIQSLDETVRYQQMVGNFGNAPSRNGTHTNLNDHSPASQRIFRRTMEAIAPPPAHCEVITVDDSDRDDIASESKGKTKRAKSARGNDGYAPMK